MGGTSSKNTYTYYLGLSAEQHVQALEIWNKIKDDTSTHNKKILTRFFESYPNYKKYFVAVYKCEPSAVTENSRVITHWQTVLDLVGFITMAVNTRRREIDSRLLYIALVHKDLGLTINDFSKYTTILISYLNQDVAYLSPTMESHWTTLMNSIFQNINDKIDRMKSLEMKSDAQGHEICITPELLGLSLPSNGKGAFFGLCKPKEKTTFPLAVPNIFNYKNKNFWRDRKEYWNQQLYWFFKDDSVETSVCTLSSMISLSAENFDKKSKSTSSLIPSVGNLLPDQVYIIDSAILKKTNDDSYTIPPSEQNTEPSSKKSEETFEKLEPHEVNFEIPTTSDDLSFKPFKLPVKQKQVSQSETSNSGTSQERIFYPPPRTSMHKRRTNRNTPAVEKKTTDVDEEGSTEVSTFKQSQDNLDSLSANFILPPQNESFRNSTSNTSKKEVISLVNSAMSSFIHAANKGIVDDDEEDPDFCQGHEKHKPKQEVPAKNVLKEPKNEPKPVTPVKTKSTPKVAPASKPIVQNEQLTSQMKINLANATLSEARRRRREKRLSDSLQP